MKLAGVSRGQVELGQRAILLTRPIREVLTERGNLKEVRNQIMWLSGEEHSSRGISIAKT